MLTGLGCRVLSGPSAPYGEHVEHDETGTLYRDHYRVLRDVQRDSSQIIVDLKREFLSYPAKVGWGCVDPATGLQARPSSARHGNLLYAINLCLANHDHHFVDRNLSRTGACSARFVLSFSPSRCRARRC